MTAAPLTPAAPVAQKYRDMTDAERLAWGIAESQLRQQDLAGIRSAEALRAAQESAERRRKAIGASRSVASGMVIEGNRHLRQQAAKATGVPA